MQFVGSGNEGAGSRGDKGHLVSIFIITHQWWPRNGANPSHTYCTCAHPSIHHDDDSSLRLAYLPTCAHPSMASSCTDTQREPEREWQLMRLMVDVDENPISARTSQFCGPPPEKLLIPPDLTRRLNCVVRCFCFWVWAKSSVGRVQE